MVTNLLISACARWIWCDWRPAAGRLSVLPFQGAHGEWIIACDANGSASFQLAQQRAGDNTVPISVVLYMDTSFIRSGIPVQPIYGKSFGPSCVPDIPSVSVAHICVVCVHSCDTNVLVDSQWAASTTTGRS